MKNLSDYKNEEAIELWADLLEPLTEILTDESFKKMVRRGESKMKMASFILKNYNKEATEILLRIDNTPLDGLNFMLRLLSVLSDIGRSDEIKSFFGYAEQVNEEEKSSGQPTVITEVVEK